MTMTADQAARAARIVPHAAPQLFDNAYTPEQHRRLLAVIRREGPWPLIIAQHFASAEELIATYAQTDAALPLRVWGSSEGWVCLAGTRGARAVD